MRELRATAALAVLWALPGVRPTARLRQAARVVLAAERARQEQEAAELARAGWTLHAPPPKSR
jgi:hypothetical protein